MDKENKPIYQRVRTLLKYGMELPPGGIVKNKSGSIILTLGPSRVLGGGLSNFRLMLNGIHVGYYSADTGDFVYDGGEPLKKMFPESRIKQAFSDLLRRYLDSDKEEFGDKFPATYRLSTSRVLDMYYHNTIAEPMDSLVMLGIFEIPQTIWDLGYFELMVDPELKSIRIQKNTTKEWLCTLAPTHFHVYSNKISEAVLHGVLYYLMLELAKWWQGSGRIDTEPPVWEWGSMLDGVRTVKLDWLAWYAFTRYSYQPGNFVYNSSRGLITTAATKVCRLLEQEHGEPSMSYVSETTNTSRREFIVKQTVVRNVY